MSGQEKRDVQEAPVNARIFQIGTAECAVFSALAAMLLGLLFLWLGFWQMVLVAVLMALGLFIGGVKNKKAWITDKINRLFPPKRSVSYGKGSEEYQRAVKAVQETREAAAAAQEAGAEQDQQTPEA